MHDLPIFKAKVFRVIETILKAIIIVTSLLLITLMSYYVFSRYLLKVNFRGFEEIATLIAVWLYFCGSAYACREQSQISANMLNMFVKNEKALACIEVFYRVVGLVVVGLLAYLCVDFLQFNASVGTKSSLLKIPMYLYHSSLVFGFVMMFIYDFLYFIEAVRKCSAILKAPAEKEEKSI